MAFNTTINFTQNVAQSLGFNNYFPPTPARNVTATFILDSTNIGGLNFATIIVPDTPGVTVITGRAAVNSSTSGAIVLAGDVTAINTCLNGCLFSSIAYSVEDIEQDVLALNRALGNNKGELQIQIPPNSDITGLAVGSPVTFSTISASGPTTNDMYRFTITKIDGSSSPIRIWMIYNRDYTLSDLVASSAYKLITQNVSYLKTVNDVTIGPVIDMAYGNAQGTLQFTFRTVDGVTEDNTFTMVGRPQIAEPVFSTLPPASVSALSTTEWNAFPPMGVVTHPQQNYLTVQLLIKTLQNDPMYLGVTDYTLLPGYPVSGTDIQKLKFIGDSINAKAVTGKTWYVKNKSYGIFGDSQANLRSSVSYPDEDQEVRWGFFGLPSECNVALSRIFMWRTSNKEFLIETRIIMSKSRIYATRGSV